GVEDQHVAEAEIRSRFGADVAAMVVAGSEQVGGSKDSTDWQDRKRRYLEHLEVDSVSDGALRVTAADKLHNARSILTELRDHGPAIWKQLNAGAADQREYYVDL